jgi:hypothetical protein
VPPIPRDGLLLHTGPPKTGSTAIQIAMHTRRATLAEHQVHYAGRAYRPREAGWAVLGIRPPIGRPPARIERWQALVDECTSHPDDRVCLSNETFARADDAAAERIVTALGTDRVHLVHVIRRMDRLLLSSWQERIKARLAMPYEDWLRLILAESSDHFEWANFWRAQSLPAFLSCWTPLVPAERITLICADEKNRALLPETFESLLGLPPGLLAPDPTRSNRGLSLRTLCLSPVPESVVDALLGEPEVLPGCPLLLPRHLVHPSKQLGLVGGQAAVGPRRIRREEARGKAEQ